MSDTLYEMKDDFGDKVEVTTVPGTVTVEFQENKGDGDVAIMDFSGVKLKKLLVLLSKAARDADIIPREEDPTKHRVRFIPSPPKEDRSPKTLTKGPHGPQEYRGNGKHSWEQVTGPAQYSSSTKRLRVPGGWLYQTDSDAVFVPMPEVVGYKI